MSDSIKTPPRPMGADMSMDDILLSIRKIIASEEQQKENVYQKQVSESIKNVSPVSERPLSLQEELGQLTNLSHQGDRDTVIERSYDTQNTSHKSPLQTPIYPDTKIEQAVQHPVGMHNLNDASEILRTLEDIKRSLSPESLREIKSHSAMIEENQTVSLDEPVHISEIKKVTINSQNDVIDLRPTQFTAGEIPDFLKRFKRENTPQSSDDVDNKTSEAVSPIYDFSQISSFDEDDSVVELTKVVLPQEENTSHDIINFDEKDDGLSDALEMLIIKSLRPMLREWIDENLTDVTEKIIREELSKQRFRK